MNTAEWIGRTAGVMVTFLIAYIAIPPVEVHEWIWWVIVVGIISVAVSNLFMKLAQAIYLSIKK